MPKAQAIQEVAQETVAAISSRNAAVGVGSYSLSSSISSVTNMNSVSPPESVSRPGKKRKRVLTPAVSLCILLCFRCSEEANSDRSIFLFLCLYIAHICVGCLFFFVGLICCYVGAERKSCSLARRE